MGRRIKDSWFVEYLKYTSGQESPELFHIFVAMAVISAVLDRDVKMDKVLYQLYPNIYVILVAGTSKCHKSVAIEIGTDLLEDIKNPPRKFAQKITNARLIQFLGENLQVADPETGKIESKASGLIAADELSSFLGKNAMDSGTITTLTDLYGCKDKWSYETKNSGTDKLTNVYLTFLGASTAKWLRSAIPQEAVGGGFISRCLFMYQQEPKRLIPFPEDEIPDDIETIRENLVHDLNHIGELKGIFTVSKKAKQWYADWYAKNDKEVSKSRNPDFFSRWHSFILKLGMIISVARDDELIVQQQDLELADYYLQSVKENMSPVLDTLTTAESELPSTDVLGLIKRRKVITHEALMNMTRHLVNSEGLQTIVQTLEEAGQIKVKLSAKEPKKYVFTGDEKDEE